MRLTNSGSALKYKFMKSRITIEIDYNNNGQPYFRIMESPTSDDVRDKAITEFRRAFKHQSQWCVVDFGQVQMDGSIQWNIHPIPPQQLESYLPAIQSVIKYANPSPENKLQ